MAYKFQMGQAILSGALEQEGAIKVENEAGSVVGKILQTGVVSGSGQLQGSSVAVDGVITAHRLAVDDSSTLGCDSDTDIMTLAAQSLALANDVDFNVAKTGGFQLGGVAVTSTAAELNLVDGITAGTVAASKAVIVDSNKDIDGFRHVTMTGDMTAGTITMSGFTVDADGDTALKSLAVDDGSTIGPDSVTDLITLAADGDITIKDGAYDFNIAAHDGTNGLKLGGTLVTSTAAELNLVDGITAGTVAASKAVIVDSNKDVSGFRNVGATGAITAGTSFIIGSADLNETDLEKLDGITNGTAAANKALVVDGNKDIASLRNLSGVQATFSSLTQGRLVTAGSSGLLEDQAALHYDDARSHGYLELRVSSSASGSGVLGDGYLNLADASDEPMFQVSEYASGSSELGVFFADTAAPVGAAHAGDRMLFMDASDSKRFKKETLGNVRDLFFGVVSGDATIAAGGALTIEADAVEQSMIADDAVGADQLAANAVVNASIASNAAIDMDKLDGGSLASSLSDLAQGDLLYAGDVDDSNNLKSITFSNFEDAIFGNVSGDATIAAGGLLSIAAAAVHADMLNDDVISGQTELAADGLAAADELLISDGGTLKKIGVDNLFIDGPALLSDSDAVDVSADFFMFLDGGGTGDAKKESIADLVSGMAGSGLSAASGQLSVQGSTVTLRASGDTLAEGYNYFADISSGSVSVTLPGASAPSPGDVVNVKAGDISGGHVLRVSPYANHTIDGQSKIDLESPFAAVSLVYVVSGSWRIV